MSQTRSSTKSSMGLTAELQDYLQKIIEPLAKSAEVAKSEELQDFVRRLDEQEKRIQVLENDNNEKNEKIKKLESQIAHNERSMATLDTRCDDIEQYTRRMSVRINGLLAPNKDETEDVLKLVEGCHADVKLEFKRSDINRAHRVGPVITNQRTGKKLQSVIVQFRSWESRCRFYKSRPRHNATGRRFTVALDMTRRRYDLLKGAREISEHYPDVSYVLCDINCNCVVKMESGDFHMFNTMDEFDELLKGYPTA